MDDFIIKWKGRFFRCYFYPDKTLAWKADPWQWECAKTCRTGKEQLSGCNLSPWMPPSASPPKTELLFLLKEALTVHYAES